MNRASQILLSILFIPLGILEVITAKQIPDAFLSIFGQIIGYYGVFIGVILIYPLRNYMIKLIKEMINNGQLRG